MENLKTGQFFGQTNETIRLKGLTLTDTEYTHEKVDWHYHENAYFTFILEGRVIEGNKKETYHCSAGSLLFHNWQESHYNIKPKGFTRGFHIELDLNWLNQYQIAQGAIQGSINIQDPHIKIEMYNIVKETKLDHRSNNLVIDSLLVALLSRLTTNHDSLSRRIPSWILKLREILHETHCESWTLQSLSASLNIHPVHLSRDFSKYFGCNLGEYIRTIKVQRSLSLLSDKRLSLTDVALESGFSDQSHFIRSFKASNNISPLHYRKLLFK